MYALKKLYADRKEKFEVSRKSVSQSLSYLSIARLTTALIFLFFGYLGFIDSVFFYFLPFIVAVFVYLVSQYGKKFRESELLQNLIRLNELEIKALDFDFTGFKSGERFVDPHHPYSYDLDLFGKGSMFQYLNRCGTEIGEEKLASLLLQPLASKQDIEYRQEAARDNEEKIDFRQTFWANATLLKESVSEKTQLLSWLKDKNFIEGKTIYSVISILFPMITISFLVMTFIDSTWTPALFLAMAVQLSIAGYHARKVKQIQLALSKHNSVMEKYAVLLQLIAQQDFESDLLNTLKEEATRAFTHIKKFASLVNALESRMNPIANAFGNSFFMYDVRCIKQLEQWRDMHGDDLSGWIDVVAETDALCAMSTFHFNNPEYVFPVIEEKLAINAVALGHPLISYSERIANDFFQGNPQTVLIVTGANMAGKSTFLRSVGVNIVLALAGAPVCARTFSCPIIGLRSGMRTSDSLQENQSYFYAELYRLQSIMQDLRLGKPLLILLDEILKGTNSTDKQSGSIAMVEQLVNLNALVLLATHDVILSALQQKFPDKVSTGCFESQVDGPQLIFDYKLKPGVAQKANATFLMKQMGIIPN